MCSSKNCCGSTNSIGTRSFAFRDSACDPCSCKSRASRNFTSELATFTPKSYRRSDACCPSYTGYGTLGYGYGLGYGGYGYGYPGYGYGGYGYGKYALLAGLAGYGGYGGYGIYGY